jgi:hypothetical protein
MSNFTTLTDRQQTGLFLSLLDANARSKSFDFRTFDDRKNRLRKDLSGNLTGTFDAKEKELLRRNADGAGVFVVINHGGHSDAAVTKVRAVFADTDGAPLEPIVEALTPHCVIATSPGNFHVYWLVDNQFPLDQFKPIQRAIAHKFGADSAVSNLSRVMRLPGFTHNKGEPFKVQFCDLRNADRPRYNVAQIIDGLGLNEIGGDPGRETRPLAATLPFSRAVSRESQEMAKAELLLRHINPWCDYERWRNVLFWMADLFGESGYDLALRWSRGDLLSSLHEGGTNETGRLL